MPDLRTHIAISRERTGKGFEDLHRWIDESHKSLAYEHRIERHVYNSVYEKYVKKRFGTKAVFGKSHVPRLAIMKRTFFAILGSIFFHTLTASF